MKFDWRYLALGILLILFVVGMWLNNGILTLASGFLIIVLLIYSFVGDKGSKQEPEPELSSEDTLEILEPVEEKEDLDEMEQWLDDNQLEEK